MSPASKPRILIVDDNPEACEALERLLEAEFDVVCTRNTAVGLEDVIAEWKPDVVLLDISMPEINGLVAARKLRKAGIDTKVIFVTEQSDPQYVKEAFRAGGAGFVVKSRAASHLSKAIRRVVAGEQFPSERGGASISSRRHEYPRQH